MIRKLKDKKGFTLAELLIVIAIIAILIGIMIPVFGGQLNKAKFATDEANVRAAYAEALSTAMLNDSYDANGKISIDKAVLQSAAKHSTVMYKNSKLTVVYNTDNSLNAEIPVDNDVVITPAD